MGTIKFSNVEKEVQQNEQIIVNSQEITEVDIDMSTIKQFEDSSILFEDKAKRTENTKIFQLNNGTSKEIISGSNMHYFDEHENRLRTIDNSLVDSGETYNTQYGIYKAEVAKNINSGKTIKFSKENLGLEWVYLPKHTHTETDACNCAIVQNSLFLSPSSDVKYENIEPNVDLQYEILGNNLKENIIIKEKLEEYKFSFKLKTNGLMLKLSEDNANIELYSSKQNAQGENIQVKEFSIPSPFMFDADGEHSDDVYYEIEHSQNEEYLFHIIADSDWSNDEDRKFPITIDPQIITNNTDVFGYQNYYRNASSGSSGSNSNWDTANYGTIKVGRNYSYQYRTTLTIKKSKLNLQNNKISKVLLKLKPSTISTYGDIYINGSYKNIVDYNVVEQDITSTFKSFSGDFTISIEPYYYGYSDIQFSASGSTAPVIEIEYLTNEKTRLTKKSFSLAGVATGEINLSTGEMITSFKDTTSDSSTLGYNISHVYKKSSDNFNIGTNFRLNLHEKLEKNSDSYLDANYIYTDSLGEKHGFMDTYYYIGSSSNKLSVDKSNITIELDGRLMYDTYEVFKEQHTSTGLKAATKLEGFKNIDLLEQRQGEIKQLEEQVSSYITNLKDIVCVNKSDGTICARLKSYFSGDKLSKFQFDSFMNSVTTSRLVLSENEALSYRSIELQYSAMGYQEIATNYQISSMGFQSTGMQLQIDSINNSMYRANSKEETQLNSNETYNYNNTKTNTFNQISYNNYQKDLTSNSIKPNASLKRTNLNNQISALENKREYYIEQIKKIYKEFSNKDFELTQMKKQMPVNYLTDGKIIKGFNEIGKLVAVYDNYNNSIVLEYDYKDRICKVFEGETKANIFKYSPSGLLSSITDTRGRKTKYKYFPYTTNLQNVIFADGRSLDLTYDDYKNISTVKSSYKLITEISYRASKITITDSSHVDKITKTTPADYSFGSLQIAQTEVTFATNNTILDDKDGNKEHYFFNSEGNNTEYYLEEQGKVTKAEQYEYVPYSTSKVKYAKKDSLNLTPKTSFNFILADYEYTTLNGYNKPSIVTTNARKIDINSTQQSTTNYSYDDDQKCEMTRATIVTVTPSKTKTNFAVAKNFYNSNSEIVRVESYVEGEELTNGKNIKETFFDDKGHQTKSITYNSLDASSKFYTESEAAENGQVTAEIDETGENKTKLNYVAGTNVVESQVLPNGSKFAYGRAIDDTVTSITQSTEDGEENSNQTHYTFGVVTELKAGNNVVNYEHDYKRRLKKVGLNDNSSYVSYDYVDNTTDNGITVNKIIATNAKNETFTSITDKKGNLRKVQYNSVDQVVKSYDNIDRLSSYIDNVSGTYSYEYDNLDRVAKFKKGTTILENYEYNSYGSLKTKTITNGVAHSYSYAYNDDSTGTLNNIKINTLTIMPKNDKLNRQSEKVILSNNANIIGEYYYYSKFGDHATNRISSIKYGSKIYGNYVVSDGLKYAYDNLGNISKVYENGLLQSSYTYDKLSRIIREDNKKLNKTFIFNYDNNGNILTRFESTYTIKHIDEIATESLTSYNYGYANNSDRLLTYNGQSFIYDNIGNPTTYRGKTVTWSKGRQMTAYNGKSFAYNGQGQRTSKVSISFTYDSSGNLLKQSNGLEFIYDNSGVIGFIHGGANYIYRKNVQGDVTAILNESGEVKAKYSYDAWGNNKLYNADGKTEDASTTSIGYLNPFRYRSYYYDTETKLYYLESRYYDPAIRRFINLDNVAIIATDYLNTFGGQNLYSYCLNNPVMYFDLTGCFTILIALILGGLAIASGIVGGKVAYDNAVSAGKTVTDLFWSTVGRVFVEASIGLAAGGLIVATAVATAAVKLLMRETGTL